MGAPHSDGYVQAVDSRASQIEDQTGLFLLVACLVSWRGGFCWGVITSSFCILYYYSKFCLWIPKSRRQQGLWPYALDLLWWLLRVWVFVILGVWCLSITPVHVLAPTFMDIWSSYPQSPSLASVEIVHNAGEDAVVDVFAIHGLGSNPDNAWTFRSNRTETRWLRDILPQIEGVGRMRIAMVNHQTRWDANTAQLTLRDHAAMALDDIEMLHKMNPDRPIIFIAHSFGGLLLKQTLLLAQLRSSSVASMTKGILFLGVPHGGTDAAFFGSLLSCTAFFRGSSSLMLEFMSTDGASVMALESEFHDIYVRHRVEDSNSRPYICDVLEMWPERVGKLTLGMTVNARSGNLRHGDVVTLATDHRGLNKFESLQDPNFVRFSRVFLKAFLHATAEEAGPSQTALTVLASGIPWALQEFLSSLIAKDKTRISKMLLCGILVGVPLEHLSSKLLWLIFGTRASLSARLLRICIRNLITFPIQAIVYIVLSALLMGARTAHQIRAAVRVGLWPGMRFIWVVSPLELFFKQKSWTVIPDVVVFLCFIYVMSTLKRKRLVALRKRAYGRDLQSKRAPQPKKAQASTKRTRASARHNVSHAKGSLAFYSRKQRFSGNFVMKGALGDAETATSETDVEERIRENDRVRKDSAGGAIAGKNAKENDSVGSGSDSDSDSGSTITIRKRRRRWWPWAGRGKRRTVAYKRRRLIPKWLRRRRRRASISSSSSEVSGSSYHTSRSRSRTRR